MLVLVLLLYTVLLLFMVSILHIATCYESNIKIIYHTNADDPWELYSLDLYMESRYNTDFVILRKLCSHP